MRTLLMVMISSVCAVQAHAQLDWNDNGTQMTTTRNVGIKTTNPQAALAVNGQHTVFGGDNPLSGGGQDTYVEIQSAENAFFGLFTGITNQVNYSSFFFISSPEFDYSGFISSANGDGKVLPITFSTIDGSTPEKMRISADGNVGIGTDDPQSKLAVNGTITAKEIIVTTSGWPDFVFSPDYNLQPLEDVEAAIKRDGHLPGIPSAKEVEGQGAALGEMQKLLLQKVEELTLHLIEMKKENETLKQRVSSLESDPN